MITIKNTQRRIQFDTQMYKTKAQEVLNFLGYHDFDLAIWLTTNATIKKYNAAYRNKPQATDILSFPYHPDLQPGDNIIPQTEDDKNLGDLIISLERVHQDAHKLGVTFEQRMYRLLVHGIVHVLGYDHQTDSEYQTMYNLEKKLMQHINWFTPDQY